MLFVRILLWLMLLYLIPKVMGIPQLNLYHTDGISESDSKTVMHHHCLYGATTWTYDKKGSYQIIGYCLSEYPSKWKIEKNNRDQNFSFAELQMLNVSSQELYLWSAPMDLIERYQFYLDQSLNSIKTNMERDLFYNCTFSWFGPICEYMFDQSESHHESFAEMLYYSYLNTNEMTSLTCYTHLQCNHSTSSMCLDWSDICNGLIDCIDGGQDEQDCWQLEINDCEEDEYRCHNGECIPNDFYRDDGRLNLEPHPECLDGSDEPFIFKKRDRCDKLVPAFLCEEVTCHHSEMDDREFRTLSSSSCLRERGKLIMQAMLSVKQNLVTDLCWISLQCAAFTVGHAGDSICFKVCPNGPCHRIIEENCPHLIYLPAVALLSGHVYFVYTNKTIVHPVGIRMPEYLCYSDQLCSEMPTTMTLISLNNTTCRKYNEIPYPLIDVAYEWDALFKPVQTLFRTCTPIVHEYPIYCNMSTMYQCLNSSKCISIYRLNDGIQDCYYQDDERFIVTEETSLKPFKECYKCKESNKCIDRRFLDDFIAQCPLGDDESFDHFISKYISFQIICDGFTELMPQNINGREETDETQCEQWPCNNLYTRCDTIWNCFNGADELNCDTLPRSNCTADQHMCISSITNQFMCLPIEQANDGFIHCLGATDEPRKCRESTFPSRMYAFYCENKGPRPCIYTDSFCNGFNDCTYGEDEQLCEPNDYITSCYDQDLSFLSKRKLFICKRLSDFRKFSRVFFSLGKINKSIRQRDTSNRRKDTILLSSPITQTTPERQQRCHRGLDLRVSLGSEKNSTISTCLCPPNYYGNTCQYQHQRVSLTVKIRTASNAWSTSFAFVVSLIDDDERMIYSYEQFIYLSARDCQKKFNIYLFYFTQPKNETKIYSIHIDAYEKESLKHRSSWLISINFPFLPVHRTVAQLIIPDHNDANEICSDIQCIHGQCTKYTNKNKTIDRTFCRCSQGWTGRYCSIPYICTCSSKSLCVGVSIDNRSICVCPLGKFGSRCLINSTACQLSQNGSCQNGGRCIGTDERIAPRSIFSCVCPKGFSGDRCQIVDTTITVSFDKDITLSESILVHFIEVLKKSPPARVTTFAKIRIDQDSATIYWPHPFHIMFVEPLKNIYYLTLVQNTYVESSTLVSTINPLYRCKHISELFNDTFVKSHLLHRIKSYHIPCQNRSLRLSCFYDDIHICLCHDFDQQRLANCFEFDHHMQHDCIGQSVCRNAGQCFQDDSTCPQSSICMCAECFYGTQCQFTTKGFGLSLDAILGYQIRPHVAIRHQPLITKISVGVTTVMLVLGLLNGILSVITFKVKSLQHVGCGLYLMGSSINCILSTIIFTFKFWLLVLSQMGSIRNQSFLHIHCISIDFLMQICVSMDQWLSACVAIERAMATIKGVQFNRKMSKQLAKWMIFVLLLIVIFSFIHDPIHRRLITDDDEQRIWCIVNYSTKLNVFNSFINIIHFLVPFFLNVISAVVIIMRAARHRSVARPHQTYREHVREQFQEHKHLVISPCVLIILSIPRLYISLISGCMKSARNPWLYLIGYFISFAPSMLTFVVFVLPSELYKTEFWKAIKQHQNTIRRRYILNH